MRLKTTIAVFLVVTLCASFAADLKAPAGVLITSESKSHVHADVSALPRKDFPALASIHALYTVYFKRNTATDEKLRVLAQIRSTNLACVVFADCWLVTDKGLECLASIPTLKQLGLRGMSITDAACQTMVKEMRLDGVNMPRCTNVTVSGLIKMAQSELMERLGFSVGNMSQSDLIRIINSAGARLRYMDIEMTESAERRLDFPALREAAKAKGVKLLAVRGNEAREL